tara:strand:- start:6013 stop:7251 length:1239 start_codon:yes stop_codon:yes gene_type:complete
MRYIPRDLPRTFAVGRDASITISDTGSIFLESDELVTFLTKSGSEYDITRKTWGYYATPSLNVRLPNSCLKPVLVSNPQSNYYLLLLESGREDEFQKYLQDEDLSVVGWLDTMESIQNLIGSKKISANLFSPKMRCICRSQEFTVVFNYLDPPKGENLFKATENKTQENKYYREIHRCDSCGHFLSVHNMKLDELYSGDYVSTTYGDETGIRRSFEKINALPTYMSDNIGRVRWINAAYSQFRSGNCSGRVLDVGAGLGVFVFQMRKSGWECVALEPDENLCSHLKQSVEVKVVSGSFLDESIISNLIAQCGMFDLITFNKVLEHVQDPVSFLASARKLLSKEGWVYIELPDGNRAYSEGKGREEFFVEHHHIFSAASISILAERAGFSVKLLESIHEPSGKFTFRALCARK